MKRFYIYAGTTEQAKNLAKDMLLEPNEWSNVYRIEKLIGIKGMPLLIYGTWRDRKDIADLRYVAATREMKILYVEDTP
jgi:hypothetical protein